MCKMDPATGESGGGMCPGYPCALNWDATMCEVDGGDCVFQAATPGECVCECQGTGFEGETCGDAMVCTAGPGSAVRERRECDEQRCALLRYGRRGWVGVR